MVCKVILYNCGSRLCTIKGRLFCFYQVKGGFAIIILVYVDDILITSNDVDAVNVFKQFLDNKFKLKDLGTLKYFLGLEVARTANGISLC